MSFRVKSDESASKAVRRIAREQLGKIRDGVGQQAQGRDEAVHDARKRFKKMRALLKLVRDEILKKTYRKENACFRDTSRPLSEVRDARVLVEALDELGQHFPEAPADELRQVREALLHRQEETARRVLDEQRALVDVAEVVRQARKRVKGWTPRAGDWSVLKAGLQRTYCQGRDALAVAHAASTDENLHEWRKRVKDLWHQLTILEPTRPDLLEGLANKAHELADHLGGDHDLVVLSETMRDVFRTEGDGAHRGEWSGLIQRRRGELQKNAFRLGDELYRDRPKDFVRRLKVYWKAWRAERKAEQLA
jgi:CHAD domain-containing protein